MDTKRMRFVPQDTWQTLSSELTARRLYDGKVPKTDPVPMVTLGGRELRQGQSALQSAAAAEAFARRRGHGLRRR